LWSEADPRQSTRLYLKNKLKLKKMEVVWGHGSDDKKLA
jgi:hypothetical protein